jgi:acetyltransferase-like isoleucine patch superfamily enzyme
MNQPLPIGWTSWLWRFEARIKGVEFEGRCRFIGRPLISVAQGSRLVLGDGVCVLSSRRANRLGSAQRCTLRALAPGSRLVIGRGVIVSGATLCAGASIEVGDGAVFEPGALIIDNDFHLPAGELDWIGDFTANARPIRIGRGVRVGPGAIVLKGVTLGDGAVIGPGAVVTKDVPPAHRAEGNPARAVPIAPTPH